MPSCSRAARVLVAVVVCMVEHGSVHSGAGSMRRTACHMHPPAAPARLSTASVTPPVTPYRAPDPVLMPIQGSNVPAGLQVGGASEAAWR